MMRRVVALVLLLPAGACGTLADRPVQHEIVDSAGIQLVRNGAAADTIVLTPDLSIGTVDGPEELQFFRVTALAVAPDGAVLVGDGSGTIREFDGAGGFVRSIGRRGDGPAAQTTQPVVEYETGRTYGIAYGSDGMTANSPLWEPRPAHAVDASGNVYLSRGSPYRIDVFDANGMHWRSVTRAHIPVLATRELNDRYWRKVDLYLDTTSNRHGEWHITVAALRGRADLPVNEALPALGRLIVSDDGMLWAQRPDLLPDPLLLEWTREGTRQDSFWDVFDHEGRFVATVHVPAAFTARAAAGRSLYGVLRDDMDVEHIARFTLPSAS